MSASLVGSEMCIRDRCSGQKHARDRINKPRCQNRRRGPKSSGGRLGRVAPNARNRPPPCPKPRRSARAVSCPRRWRRRASR
eukprot:7604730-Alexandrium_andersonii.AAC.1